MEMTNNQAMSVASDLTGLLASYADKHGVPRAVIDEALASVGVRPTLSAPTCGTGRLPYLQWCAALEALYERVDDPALGIHVGQSVEAGHCGVLGYLVLSANTLAEALAQFERYQLLLYGGSLGQASFVGDSLVFEWPAHDKTRGVGLSDEALVYGLFTFIARMVGSTAEEPVFKAYLAQSRIAFVHEPTASVADYLVDGLAEVRFGAPLLRVEVPIAGLSLPISNRDPALFSLLNQQAEALLNVLPDQQDDFDIRVRDYLRKALPEGAPTLDGLAAALAMSARTVHRRLAERGMNFGALLQQTREQLARQYLDEGRISLSEVAFMLGYSQQSAFSRAFRHWTGQTPRQYLNRAGRAVGERR